MVTTKCQLQEQKSLLPLLLDQQLMDSSLSLTIAVEDDKGNVSEPYKVPVKRVDAGTGNLQVSLSWDIDNDIDLHLVQPDSQEIYYGNEVSGNGGELDVDSNAGCSIDGIRNENITFGDSAVVLAGEYIVRVDFYEECVAAATTNYTVVAYLQGDIVATTSGSNPVAKTFATGTATGGGAGDGVEVMRFNVPEQIGKQGVVVIDYGYTNRLRKAAQAGNGKK